jgi:hypothetical protein
VVDASFALVLRMLLRPSWLNNNELWLFIY